MLGVLIGVIGGGLVLLAWILGLRDEIKSHKNLIELRFSIITSIGVLMLIYYSFLKNDPVFLFLNLGILLVVLFEIIYTFHIVGKKK
ncbi:MAG: hypothetical protein J7L08_03765 [Candidatus Aenigmarchaeota archaeon]|nr:hypothetical protein [Candidatus Aenigmarchaeota archaeon]